MAIVRTSVLGPRYNIVWGAWRRACRGHTTNELESHMSNSLGAPVYCTIVAQNYLPQAMTLYESIQRHEPGRELVLFVVDGDRQDLAKTRPYLRLATSDDLGLAPRQFEQLAMIYDVVELSTAVKPLLLRGLLDHHEWAAYLDPDTYLVAPLDDLGPALAENPIAVTPHFLEPIAPGSSYISEVHSLTVGIHNLGFCAVGQGAQGFLEWWWSHLERECLIYPLLGIFVDQKWTDVGVNLFQGASLRHPGYNVGPWNLHERPITLAGGVYVIGADQIPLRLVHFSGFNPRDPDAISVRLNTDLRGRTGAGDAFRALSREYAEAQLRLIDELGELPAYGFSNDSHGHRLTSRLRRTYRAELIARDAQGRKMPSAFDPADQPAYDSWRRGSWRAARKIALADAAIAAKYASPDLFRSAKNAFPRMFQRQRATLLKAGEVRR